MELESAITDVVVYTDRAQVTRTAAVTLEKGEQQLRFADLPDAIERNSVQVNGTGDMELRDVAFSTVHFAEPPDERRRELRDARRKLKGDIREVDGKLGTVNAEKTFLEGITGKLTTSTEKGAPGELDPDRWIKMVEFYRAKLEQLDTENRQLEDQLHDLRETLRTVEAQLSDLGRERERTRNVVDVTVEAPQAGEATLRLSYIVYGPSWEPIYDLRTSTDAGKMSVTYNGMVRQSTGEDWTDVAVSLSTAQVGVSGEEPELDPWRIDYKRYTPQPDMVMASAMAPAPARAEMKKRAAPAEELDDMDEMALAEEPPAMAMPEAEVQTGATAVLFTVPGRTDIPSDNNPHRVSIMMHEFDAELTYGTVPKLAPYAYLKATVTNDTNYPFLPGEANVFLDGSFVATSALELVAPKQKFTTSLGVDEAVKVERVFVKKFQKDEGVLSKKTKFIYEYRIELTNNRTGEAKITLMDQLPISQNKEIVVDPIEPKVGKDGSPKKDDLQMLTWELTLAAGEKKVIPLSFSVEFPRGSKVDGLE